MFALLYICLSTHQPKIGLSYLNSVINKFESSHDFSECTLWHEILRTLIILFPFLLTKLDLRKSNWRKRGKNQLKRKMFQAYKGHWLNHPIWVVFFNLIIQVPIVKGKNPYIYIYIFFSSTSICKFLQFFFLRNSFDLIVFDNVKPWSKY